MSMDPQEQLKITAAVCSSVALASTAFRLYIRWTRETLWYDDAWAIMSTIALVIQLAAVFMPGPSGTLGVARYYMMGATFTTMVWWSRLSILFSLIRIEPDWFWIRIWRVVGAAFFISWMVSMGQLFWECVPKTEWKHMPSPQCNLSDGVAILQLTSDCIADLILLIIPTYMFRVLQQKELRRRLILIFSTCVITTIVSLVHSYYIIVHAGLPEVIAGIVENCVSLIVCNLPLVVTRLLKISSSYEERHSTNGTSRWPTWMKTTMTIPGAADSRDPPVQAVSVSLPQQSDLSGELHSMKLIPSRSDVGSEDARFHVKPGIAGSTSGTSYQHDLQSKTRSV